MPAALHAEHPPLDWGIVLIFATVYLGMFLGGLPKLKLDRAGVALLGAIAVIGSGALDTEQAARAVDLPTLVLLFSFMVLSAQMRLGGFYGAVTRAVAALPLPPHGLLGALLFVAAALSAVFSNDVVCLALTPVVARICLTRGYTPLPFLIGLACAANIGSAATLIGNPQNMLIGSLMKLSFADYLRAALPPVALSLLALWIWLALIVRRQPTLPPSESACLEEEPPFDVWQTAKGLLIASALLVIFLFTTWPREVVALVAAGLLLLSRRFHSSHVLGFVDWELLVLFIGLFIVNHAFEATGLATQAVTWLAGQGIHLAEPLPLFAATLGLSNLVSNVPAVMLLIPHLSGPMAGTTLALVSTLAGNLLLVGSIANLIVVDLAKRDGIEIDWRAHAKIGVPITIATLIITWFWLQSLN